MIKGMHSIDSIKTYAHGATKDLVFKKEEIKCDNVRNNTEIINFDDTKRENKKEHNLNWPKLLVIYTRH